MNIGPTGRATHRRLTELLSSAFESRTFVAGNNEVLYRMLCRSPEVRELRAALGTGEIQESEIRHFANALLNDFKSGVLFEHDIALAAIAVALTTEWRTPFAEEYVIDLAKLRNPEFRRSIAIARLATKRLYEESDTISRSFRSQGHDESSSSWQLIQPGREECSDRLEEFTL